METVTGFELHQNQWVYCSKQVRRTRLLDCSTFMNATYWWKSWKVLAARTGSITGTVNGKCGRGLCIQTPLRAAMADLCTALCQPGFSGGFGCQSVQQLKLLWRASSIQHCFQNARIMSACTYSCCLCWALGVLVLFWLQIKICVQVLSSSWASQIGE